MYVGNIQWVGMWICNHMQPFILMFTTNVTLPLSYVNKWSLYIFRLGKVVSKATDEIIMVEFPTFHSNGTKTDLSRCALVKFKHARSNYLDIMSKIMANL